MNLRRTPRRSRSRLAAVGLSAAVVATLAVTYPSTAGAQDVHAAASVTVRPDPSYQQPAFEGCW
jgi:hypothetical protein